MNWLENHFHLAKQTELIESIQEILNTDNSVQKFKTKIAKAIKINRLNKNEWKSFENNLLKSNEDFVKDLTNKYKSLTAKDVKLCIYLKMNLSSKEIAPLMNISYRGVELHRYRLRKKMMLEQDVNLNTFMNKL
jgi:AraC family chitin signaling transcriptional activator